MASRVAHISYAEEQLRPAVKLVQSERAEPGLAAQVYALLVGFATLNPKEQDPTLVLVCPSGRCTLLHVPMATIAVLCTLEASSTTPACINDHIVPHLSE